MTEAGAAKPPSGRPETRPAGDSEPVDLGILFVHGIGDQAQGETLTQMAEPLIAWIRQWLRTEEPADSLIASAATSAALRPPLLDSATPAHAHVLLGASRHGVASGEVRAERWLLAEAWWSPQVLTPPLGSFTGWLLTCAPWVSLFHFSQLWITDDVRGWRRALIVALVTPVWMLWSLAISAVLVVLYLLALIPIGRLRAVFSRALRRLSGIVGDAYVKIRHPLQRRAMEDATIRAMQWLAPRCRRLVVIAHSQGAAIAHGAMQRDETPHVHLFVTVGAGMAKLSALRFFQELSGSDRLAPMLAAPFTLAAIIVALRLRQPGVEAGSVWWPPATLGVLALALVVSAWTSVGRARTDLKRPSLPVALGPDRAERWCDIVATYDPVPAGNITQFFDLPDVVARRVDVLRSIFQDHTRYWSAGAAFMPALVEELVRCSASSVLVIDQNDARFVKASRLLNRDLHVLRATAWLDALAVALPLVVASDRVVDGVTGFRRFLRGDSAEASAPFAFVDDWLGTFSAWLQWLAPVSDQTAERAVNWCTAAALLVVVWFVWRRALFAVWSAWSANRTSEALRRADRLPTKPYEKPSERLTASMVPVVANVLFLVVTAVPIAIASLWTYAPGQVNEAGLYWALGLIPIAMLLVMLAIVVAGAAADEATEVGRALEDPAGWRLEWPNLRAGMMRVYKMAFFVSLVMALIGSNLDVASALADLAVPILGAGMYLWAMRAALDRCWTLMDAVPSPLRTALMLLPPTSGVVLTLALRDRAEVGALVSVAALVSVLGGWLLWAVLRLALPRPQADTAGRRIP